MIQFTKALLYCAGKSPKGQSSCPKVEGDWQRRWTPIRKLLTATGTPIYFVAADSSHQQQERDAAPFDFSASAYSEDELSRILSEPSVTGINNVLIAGCYAETLITDVALAALKHGYDTFIIWDRVWAISKPGLDAAKARLLQAGAVPTSIDQVVYQWG